MTGRNSSKSSELEEPPDLSIKDKSLLASIYLSARRGHVWRDESGNSFWGERNPVDENVLKRLIRCGVVRPLSGVYVIIPDRCIELGVKEIERCEYSY